MKTGRVHSRIERWTLVEHDGSPPTYLFWLACGHEVAAPPEVKVPPGSDFYVCPVCTKARG